MIVIVKVIGDLKDYFGKEPHEIELPEHARVRELYQRIEQFWGAEFPPYLWDFEKHQFRGPIFLVMNKKALQDLDAALENGSEINIIRAIAGGRY